MQRASRFQVLMRACVDDGTMIRCCDAIDFVGSGEPVAVKLGSGLESASLGHKTPQLP